MYGILQIRIYYKELAQTITEVGKVHDLQGEK